MGAPAGGGDAGKGRGSGDPLNAERHDIDRRRDELLANARKQAEGTSGAERAAAADGASGSMLAGLGLQFVVVILICLYSGLWLDRKLGTGPWLQVVGVVIGASVGFYVLVTVMTRETRRADAARAALKKTKE